MIKEESTFSKIKPSTNIYVISPENGIIWDAGYGNRRIIKSVLCEIEKIRNQYISQNKKFNLTRILISHSHSDHFSGLKQLRDKLNLKTVLTQNIANILRNRKAHYDAYHADAYQDYFIVKKRSMTKVINYLEHVYFTLIAKGHYIEQPDKIIQENSEIIINGEKWCIFPTPGHSFDHISLYNEKNGILFSGDLVFKEITTWLGPPESNIKDYIKTVECIKNLPNLKLILTSHGDPIDNPQDRLKEILAHRKKRMEQVLNLVNNSKEKGITPPDIVKALYPDSRLLRQIARGWVCLTLKMLEEEGKIKRKELKKEIKFLPV